MGSGTTYNFEVFVSRILPAPLWTWASMAKISLWKTGQPESNSVISVDYYFRVHFFPQVIFKENSLLPVSMENKVGQKWISSIFYILLPTDFPNSTSQRALSDSQGQRNSDLYNPLQDADAEIFHRLNLNFLVVPLPNDVRNQIQGLSLLLSRFPTTRCIPAFHLKTASCHLKERQVHW